MMPVIGHGLYKERALLLVEREYRAVWAVAPFSVSLGLERRRKISSENKGSSDSDFIHLDKKKMMILNTTKTVMRPVKRHIVQN